MRITTKRHRLAARWNPKARDLEAELAPRFDNSDIRYLLTRVFTEEVTAELERRGFDLATLRFRIDKAPEAIAEHERLAGRARPKERMR